MTAITLQSMVSVLKVKDYAAALAFYQQWLGEPDSLPAEGTAEWHLLPDTWLQLDASQPEAAGQGAIVLGVADVAQSRRNLLEAGIAVGEVADYGFVRVSDFYDPDGNRISLAELAEG